MYIHPTLTEGFFTLMDNVRMVEPEEVEIGDRTLRLRSGQGLEIRDPGLLEPANL